MSNYGKITGAAVPSSSRGNRYIPYTIKITGAAPMTVHYQLPNPQPQPKLPTLSTTLDEFIEHFMSIRREPAPAPRQQNWRELFLNLPAVIRTRLPPPPAHFRFANQVYFRPFLERRKINQHMKLEWSSIKNGVKKQEIIHGLATFVEDTSESRNIQWPAKLNMEIMPKSILVALKEPYLKHCRKFVLDMQQRHGKLQDAMQLDDGYVGCVLNQPGEIKAMVIFALQDYTDNSCLIGVVPNNQDNFAHALENEIQRYKAAQTGAS